MEEIGARLPGTVSSDLDAAYTIADGPRGMLLGHCLTLQPVRRLLQSLNNTYCGLQRKSTM